MQTSVLTSHHLDLSLQVRLQLRAKPLGLADHAGEGGGDGCGGRHLENRLWH